VDPLTCNLYPGKYPWCPLNMKLGGPQSRSGSFGEEKNILTLPGYETQTVQPIASPYTNYATLALKGSKSSMFNPLKTKRICFI
jgi:hypothetical protein